VYNIPTVDEIMAQLAGARVFHKLDANSGFWQMPLATKLQPLATFIVLSSLLGLSVHACITAKSSR